MHESVSKRLLGDSESNILVYENVLPENLLSEIKDFCQIAKFEKGGKDPDGFWHKRIESPDTMPDNVVEALKIVFEKSKNIISDVYDVKVGNETIDIILAVWKPAMGMHSHVDDKDYKHYNISVLFYVNDNYSGGEIYFKHFNKVIKPKENSLLIFPCHDTYEHEVKVVRYGHRYTSSNWFSIKEDM